MRSDRAKPKRGLTPFSGVRPHQPFFQRGVAGFTLFAFLMSQPFGSVRPELSRRTNVAQDVASSQIRWAPLAWPLPASALRPLNAGMEENPTHRELEDSLLENQPAAGAEEPPWPPGTGRLRGVEEFPPELQIKLREIREQVPEKRIFTEAVKAISEHLQIPESRVGLSVGMSKTLARSWKTSETAGVWPSTVKRISDAFHADPIFLQTLEPEDAALRLGPVGRRIRLLARVEGITLAELAQHAGTGPSPIRKILDGEITPTRSTLFAIADALGRSPVQIETGFAPPELELLFAPAGRTGFAQNVPDRVKEQAAELEDALIQAWRKAGFPAEKWEKEIAADSEHGYPGLAYRLLSVYPGTLEQAVHYELFSQKVAEQLRWKQGPFTAESVAELANSLAQAYLELAMFFETADSIRPPEGYLNNRKVRFQNFWDFVTRFMNRDRLLLLLNEAPVDYHAFKQAVAYSNPEATVFEKRKKARDLKKRFRDFSKRAIQIYVWNYEESEEALSEARGLRRQLLRFLRRRWIIPQDVGGGLLNPKSFARLWVSAGLSKAKKVLNSAVRRDAALRIALTDPSAQPLIALAGRLPGLASDLEGPNTAIGHSQARDLLNRVVALLQVKEPNFFLDAPDPETALQQKVVEYAYPFLQQVLQQLEIAQAGDRLPRNPELLDPFVRSIADSLVAAGVEEPAGSTPMTRREWLWRGGTAAVTGGSAAVTLATGAGAASVAISQAQARRRGGSPFPYDLVASEKWREEHEEGLLFSGGLDRQWQGVEFNLGSAQITSGQKGRLVASENFFSPLAAVDRVWLANKLAQAGLMNPRGAVQVDIRPEKNQSREVTIEMPVTLRSGRRFSTQEFDFMRSWMTVPTASRPNIASVQVSVTTDPPEAAPKPVMVPEEEWYEDAPLGDSWVMVPVRLLEDGRGPYSAIRSIRLRIVLHRPEPVTLRMNGWAEETEVYQEAKETLGIEWPRVRMALVGGGMIGFALGWLFGWKWGGALARSSQHLAPRTAGLEEEVEALIVGGNTVPERIVQLVQQEKAAGREVAVRYTVPPVGDGPALPDTGYGVVDSSNENEVILQEHGIRVPIRDINRVIPLGRYRQLIAQAVIENRTVKVDLIRGYLGDPVRAPSFVRATLESYQPRGTSVMDLENIQTERSHGFRFAELDADADYVWITYTQDDHRRTLEMSRQRGTERVEVPNPGSGIPLSSIIRVAIVQSAAGMEEGAAAGATVARVGLGARTPLPSEMALDGAAASRLSVQEFLDQYREQLAGEGRLEAAQQFKESGAEGVLVLPPAVAEALGTVIVLTHPEWVEEVFSILQKGNSARMFFLVVPDIDGPLPGPPRLIIQSITGEGVTPIRNTLLRIENFPRLTFPSIEAMRNRLTPGLAYSKAIEEALRGQPIGSVFGVMVLPDGTTAIFV